VGKSASQKNLDNWVAKYHLDYPAVLDPGRVFAGVSPGEAYPFELVVRTRDMKIVHTLLGGTDDALWTVFEKVIAGEPVLPGE
jgi:hypothetical protein